VAVTESPLVVREGRHEVCNGAGKGIGRGGAAHAAPARLCAAEKRSNTGPRAQRASYF